MAKKGRSSSGGVATPAPPDVERKPLRIDWEREAQKIGKRSWVDLRQRWYDVVPTNVAAGEAPAEGIEELASLAQMLPSVHVQHGYRADDEPSGLRQGMLREGLFLLHKAAHVIGASAVHIRQGMLTWSISSAYQAAAFGMRSVLLLVGVTVLEVESVSYLVDAWAPPEGTTKKQRNMPPGVLLHRVARADHKALWTILGRVLRCVDVDPSVWPTATIEALAGLSPTDFSRQRNHLHYRTRHWPLADLHACAPSDTFGALKANFFSADDTEIDPRAEDFSITLGLAMVFLGLRLLKDLAAVSSNALQAEVDLCARWIGEDFLSGYREQLS